MNFKGDHMEKEILKIQLSLEKLSKENVSDGLILKNYKDSLIPEKVTLISEVQSLYEEAQFFFPEKVTKRLKDVEHFHRQLLENRKDFLTPEIKRLKSAISKRNQKKRALLERRAELKGENK